MLAQTAGMADGKAEEALARFGAAGSAAELIAALEAIKTFAEQMGGGANVAGGGLTADALFKIARVKKEELGALWTPEAAKALGDAARALAINCECGEPATHVCRECDGACE